MNDEHQAVRHEVTKSLGLLGKIESTVVATLSYSDIAETEVSEIKSELSQWLHLLENKPKQLEVYLTGNNPRGKVYESSVVKSVVDVSKNIFERATHFISQLPTEEKKVQSATRKRKETFIGTVLNPPSDLFDVKAGDRLISIHTGSASEVIGIQAHHNDETKVGILFRHFDGDIPYIQKEVYPSTTTDWIAHIERPSNAGEYFGKEILQLETKPDSLMPGVVFATKTGSRGVILQRSTTALGDLVLKIIGRSGNGEIKRGKLLLQDFPFYELISLEKGQHASLTPLTENLKTMPGEQITSLQNLQIGDILVSNSGTTREVFETVLNPHKQLEFSFLTRRPGEDSVEISILEIGQINTQQINYMVRPDTKSAVSQKRA